MSCNYVIGTLSEPTVSDHLLNISEVAVYLNMKSTTLYSYVERKQIPHIRIGTQIRFKLQQIDAWLAELTIEVNESERGNDDYRGFNKSRKEMDEIVQRAIAVSGNVRYTAKRGKQPASGKEV